MQKVRRPVSPRAPRSRFGPRVAGAWLAVFVFVFAFARTTHADWPTVEDVWRASRERAPESVRAQSETLVARAGPIGARASSFGNPYLQLTADHGIGATPVGASSGLAVTGQLALPIELAGQRSARIGAADALVAWREREQAAAEGRAGGAALVAYGRALVARARLELGSQAEGEARSELAWFEARALAGDATAVDRSLAQAELAHYAQLRAEAQIELAGAMADLHALTGLSDAGEPPSEGAPPPQPRGVPSGRAAEQVATSSPAIQAFDREATYWTRQTDVARTKRSAPLDVLVTGGQDEFGQIRVGGGLAWAFPFVRRNEGEIALALAETSRARADREAVSRAVAESVRGLDEQLARTLDAVSELDRTGIPAASGLVQATTAAFKAGKLELVRVLIARRDLALMRGRRLDLVEAGWRAYGELAAMGGGLP